MRLLLAGAILLALACALGAWIFARGNAPFAVDAWWNETLRDAAGPTLLTLSRVLDAVGRAWLSAVAIPVIAAVVLLVRRRPWSAAFVVLAPAASAVVVQVLKLVWGRARPEEVLVTTDVGSFPSGHVTYAAALAAVAVILVRWYPIAVVGGVWVLLMALSRTVLHAHWLTDTLGGALTGAATALLIAAAFARPLARERERSVRARGVDGGL